MSAMYCMLGGHGLVRFDGADAQSFLHGQLTCDVNGLAADGRTYGAYCTPKGRALATFLLWTGGGGYAMQLPRSLCEPVRKRMSMYILRSRVRAADVTAEHAQYGIAGSDASTLVAALIDGVAPAPGHVAHGTRGTAVALADGRYLAIVGQQHAPALQATLAGAQAQSATWWDALDIAAGIATVLPATQELFVPQMLNLDALGGVSFNKGCYPGQEIVARMHYLGRLKERLFRAHVETPHVPQPGDRVFGVDFGTQAAGTVVNALPAGASTSDLLAVIHTSSVAAGPVRLASPEGPALRFDALPYELPEK